MADRQRPTDDVVGKGMTEIADRMLAQRETEYGTPTHAMSDEQRRRAYVLTALLVVGAIVVTLIVVAVGAALDR